jgi:hypothetical protein
MALNLDPGVPVMLCDARHRASGKDVLIALLEHALRTVGRADEVGAPV